LCLYVSPHTGTYYAFVSDSSGTVQQWALVDDGNGQVDATKVRTLSLGMVIPNSS
jgi:myo-inositol-hexaphosphate 3-phosphohydrolase